MRETAKQKELRSRIDVGVLEGVCEVRNAKRNHHAAIKYHHEKDTDLLCEVGNDILEAIKCLEAGLVPGWPYEGEGPPYKTVEVCDRQSGTLLFILKTPGGAEVTIEPKQEQIGNYLSSDFVNAYISSIRIH